MSLMAGPVIARHFPEQDCLFQDDNAPRHRANDVKHYKEENHINCLEWPAQSDYCFQRPPDFRLKIQLCPTDLQFSNEAFLGPISHAFSC
jgi:hypothetical protein